MPFTPLNPFQANTQQFEIGNALEHAMEGYKASRLPRKLRQQEEQRDLANRLQQENIQREQTLNRYLPRKSETDIENVLAQTGLYGAQTRGKELETRLEEKYGARRNEANIGLAEEQRETARIQNRIERLYGQRAKLAGIRSAEALARMQEIDNEIEEETGLLNRHIDMTKKLRESEGQKLQNEWYPITQGINASKGLGEIEAQDQTNELNSDFSRTQREQEQEQRRIENERAEHTLKLQKDHDKLLLDLRILKERGGIDEQQYDIAIKKINSEFIPRIKALEVEQNEANIGSTRAGTENVQENTIGQAIKNNVERKHAQEREELAQKLTKGLITGKDYDNEIGKINSEYQEAIKKNEVTQGKENIAATRAGTENVQAATQAQNFKNRLDGEYGEEDRKIAQKQAQESVKQTEAQNATLWDNLQREMKFGDKTKAAELQNAYDASAANQAKVYKDMAEANKHERAYKDVPEGSVPISEFSRGAQTAILKEQTEMQAKIESAEKGLRKLDRLAEILESNSGRKEFSESFTLALTASGKDGVVSALSKALIPGQNKQQRADAEEFVKLSNDLVLDLGSAALGARFTDTKFRALQASKPYYNNTNKANKAVIAHLRKEFEPLVKFKKDFQKARHKYTLPFDYEKYSDIPLDQLSDDEFAAIELAQGLK